MLSLESLSELRSVLNSSDDLRYIYDHLVDYMYDAKWYKGGMFESYGVILEFETIEKTYKHFTKYEINLIIKTLRAKTYTPLALVLATFLERRVSINP